jgi:hypothetical protein
MAQFIAYLSSTRKVSITLNDFAPWTLSLWHTWGRTALVSSGPAYHRKRRTKDALKQNGEDAELCTDVEQLHTNSLGAYPTENTVSIVISQQYLDCCLRIRCSGNVFTQPLPSNGRLLIRLFYSNGCTRYNIFCCYLWSIGHLTSVS